MSVVTTEWRQHSNIRYDGTMHGVNTIISEMTEQCVV
jgi:hypothetical protein